MSQSNSTILETTVPQAQVSWHSAFWGLSALAVTAMCQPAGKVCDAPRAIGPLLRASPIICFIDMLSILVRLAMYSIDKRSFREACILVMTQRYAYDQESAQAALSDFRYNAPWRWVSFAITVTQSVKLFACHGLLWTKVWAAMYLAFFLTVEIQVFISRPYLPADWPPTKRPADAQHIPLTKGFRSLPIISSAAGAVFSIYFLIRAVAFAFKHQGRPFNILDCTGIILLVAGNLVFVPSSYYSYVARRDREKALVAQILLGAVTAVALAYIFALMQHTTSPVDPRVANMVVPTLILLWAVLSLSWDTCTFKRADLDFKAKRRLEMALALYFFVLNLVAAVLYYCFGYDAESTVKPAWTEQLG